MFPASFRLARPVLAIQTGAGDISGRLEDAPTHFAIVHIDGCGHFRFVRIEVVSEVATETSTVINVVRTRNPFNATLAAPRLYLPVAAALFGQLALAAGLRHCVRESSRNDGVQERTFAVWPPHDVPKYSRRLINSVVPLAPGRAVDNHRAIPAA